MVTKIEVGRKIISSVLSAIILSFFLEFVHGYASLSVYFMYIVIGYSLIGIPCSIITDVITFKLKGTISYLLLGLFLHLLFAGIVAYLISLSGPEGFHLSYASVFVYSVFLAAAGLWLVDIILKKCGFPDVGPKR
jgi:hypothetical protein